MRIGQQHLAEQGGVVQSLRRGAGGGAPKGGGRGRERGLLGLLLSLRRLWRLLLLPLWRVLALPLLLLRAGPSTRGGARDRDGAEVYAGESWEGEVEGETANEGREDYFLIVIHSSGRQAYRGRLRGRESGRQRRTREERNGEKDTDRRREEG